MPASTVPGEQVSPTQPFPTRPPPFAHQGVSEDDLIDFTADLEERGARGRRPLRPRAAVHAAVAHQRRAGRHRRHPRPPRLVGVGQLEHRGVRSRDGALLRLLPRRAARLPPRRRLGRGERGDDVLQPEPRRAVPGRHPPREAAVGPHHRHRPQPGSAGVAGGQRPRGCATIPPCAAWTCRGWASPAARSRWSPPRCSSSARAATSSAASRTTCGGRPSAPTTRRRARVVWETELPAGTTGGPMTYLHQGRQYIVVPPSAGRDRPAGVGGPGPALTWAKLAGSGRVGRRCLTTRPGSGMVAGNALDSRHRDGSGAGTARG